jgi:RNA polymerase sigma factor (sigma-70 family)
MSAANTALARLYQAHAGELHGFARRRVGRQEAEDSLEEMEIDVLHDIAATLEQPRPYLFRIAANLAIDIARKANIRLRHGGQVLELARNSEALPSPETAAGSTLELRRLDASLSELPQLCREAFLLNRIEELSHAEIAKRLGVSTRTVDRYMAKALAHLRAKFGRPYES